MEEPAESSATAPEESGYSSSSDYESDDPSEEAGVFEDEGEPSTQAELAEARKIILPVYLQPVEQMFPIHNRAAKSFETFLSRVRRAMDLTRLTVEDCVKELKLLDLDQYPESCMVRTRFIAILREALLQTSTRAAFSEEVLAFLDSEVKLIVEHNFPQNVEEFVFHNLRKIKEKPPFWFPLDPVECILCVERTSDCRLLPGTSEVFCTCKEMPVCVECMLRHYWENSDCNRRSFAVCPQCRGEFPLSSLIHVRYESRTATPTGRPFSIVGLSEQDSPLIIPSSVVVGKRPSVRQAESRQQETPYSRPPGLE